jgi:hypothetical protein
MMKIICKCQDSGYCIEDKEVDYSVCEKCFMNDMSPNYKESTINWDKEYVSPYPDSQGEEDDRRREEYYEVHGKDW